MRIHLAIISCLLFLLALACAAPSSDEGEGSLDDTGRSSGNGGGGASCYDIGYDDCYYGYYPVATCDVTAYCTGYCDCDGWGEYCDVCA